MNLGTMRTELQARGVTDLSNSRANQFLNDAYHSLCEMEAWPFLETTASGSAPLTVSDLRAVLYVLDTSNDLQLAPGDARDLSYNDPDFATTTGSPNSYWIDGSAVKVYPVSTVTLSVRYLKVPADLSADGDTPVVPTRYHQLIVDLAQVKVLGRDRDNPELVAGLRQEVDRDLAQMRDTLLDRNYDSPDYILVRSSGFDW